MSRNWPEPTRADNDRFCQIEGWRRVRDARGRTGTHHITYELDLPEGGTLRTRVTHPPDRTTYGASLWSHVLRDQLGISEGEFWACLQESAKPGRGTPAVPGEALPAEMVHLLLTRVGLSEAEVAAMNKTEAAQRLNEFWTQGS